ncbi:MAG: DNA-binding protein WhiA [bacterium]|nr:DNA-binding protein WhiA [bacterium]
MTFNTSLKEEISKNEYSLLEARCELEAFIKCNSKITNKTITMTVENASVARKIYKDIKKVFNISSNIIVRIQKRFHVKQIYILEINNNITYIKDVLNINNDNIFLASDEEKIAFLEGAFLAIGNITNPSTSRYHLEFICKTEKIANFLNNILLSFDINSKIITRGYKYIVYIKNGDNISDILKMFKATNSLFFFEDIRIYRDHKNMVNRLNNCELSNQTKSTQTGLRQLSQINYILDNDLLSLLDDNTKIILEIRKKYPEISLNEIAAIASNEYGYKIGKSGVNHHFIKIANLVKRHSKNNEVN